MASGVQIRLATPADHGAMSRVLIAADEQAQLGLGYELERRFGPLTLTAKSLEAKRQPFKWEAFVAEVNGSVVGFAGWRVIDSKGLGELKGNYVDPAFQRRRISTALVEAVMGKLQSLGPQVLKVRTEQSNPVARHIYEKVGFELLATAPHFARRVRSAADCAARPNGFQIRPAGEHDAGRMLSLELSKAQRWLTDETLLMERRHGPMGGKGWEDHHQAPADVSNFLVAERGGEIAGYIAVGPCAEDREGHIHGLVLDQRHEDGPLGALLVDCAAGRLAEGGAEIVTIETVDNDRPAAGAMIGAGFEPVGAIVIYTRENLLMEHS